MLGISAKQHICSICFKHFSRADSLSRHLLTVHRHILNQKNSSNNVYAGESTINNANRRVDDNDNDDSNSYNSESNTESDASKTVTVAFKNYKLGDEFIEFRNESDKLVLQPTNMALKFTWKNDTDGVFFEEIVEIDPKIQCYTVPVRASVGDAILNIRLVKFKFAYADQPWKDSDDSSSEEINTSEDSE